MKVERILETSLYAQDLAAAVRFYRDVLGLEVISDMGERGITFKCGEAVLVVFNPERTRTDEVLAPKHGAEGPGHVAFAVPESEHDAWRVHLRSCGVEIEREVRWKEGHSIYFRDPAGNCVEIASPILWGLRPRT